MKNKIRITLISLAVIIFSIILFYIVIIIKARADTPHIVAKALHSKNVTLKINDLSQWQLYVLLAVEDPDFYHHSGVDFKTPGAGLTTITQGLVKLFYFEDFKPGIAKLKQSVIARFALNMLTSKNDQLTLFINYVNLGEIDGKNVAGLDNAALGYYRKSLSQLNNDEYISLIAMIIAPENFHIINHKKQNMERCERIKKVLAGTYKPKSLMDVYYDKSGK